MNRLAPAMIVVGGVLLGIGLVEVLRGGDVAWAAFAAGALLLFLGMDRRRRGGA